MQLSGSAADPSLTLPSQKNQPSGSYVFPKRNFGKSQPARSLFHKRNFGKSQPALLFLPERFKMFLWLHYNESTDLAFCFDCMTTAEKHFSKRDEAFITRGYTNWKNATSAFNKHEDSACNKQVVTLSLLPQQCRDIGEIMSSQLKDEKKAN